MNQLENDEYERGHMRGQLESLHEGLRRVEAAVLKLEAEIRTELGWMRDEVTSIKLWKAKVVGAAMVVATVMSFVVDFIKTHWR